jgi:hypothetical protein
LALFPYDPALSYNMAEQYRLAGMCGPALPLYEWTHNLDPEFPRGYSAYAFCLLNQDRFDDAKAQALRAISKGADVRSMRRIIFIADSVQAASKDPAGRAVTVARATSNLPDSVQKAAPRHSGSPIR